MIALEKKFMRKIHKEMVDIDLWSMHFAKPVVYSKDMMGFGEHVLDKDMSLEIHRTKESPGGYVVMRIIVLDVFESFKEEYLNDIKGKNVSFNVNDAFK